jgi:hypothetical protein
MISFLIKRALVFARAAANIGLYLSVGFVVQAGTTVQRQH